MYSSPNENVHIELYNVYLSSNFKNCSERLCEGIDETQRKDDSFNSTLAIYLHILHELFLYAEDVLKWFEAYNFKL